MECLGCNLIEISAVTLLDGRNVCNECPDWRHECEVRELARWESNEKRREFLAGVERARGKDAAKKLRVDVWGFMQKAKA